jgi:alkanesulfonate monooxygenase SsuD/methylene tetrahydromethanopterin reductase-like flavin-dependent oxidoreductase (luciferase family)
MKYGFVIPGGDLKTVLRLADEAEKAQWDAIFYWDAIYIKQLPVMFDAWTVLAAIACRTQKIRIGALLTAVNRRRPWKLARESVTVDHLSGGRLIMPVGLGAVDDGGYGSVGEPVDRRTRADLLDEGLDILNGLWTGRPFSYYGKHFSVDKMEFRPRPLQKPRIPIWVVGAWGRPKSMNRALKYDGIIPTKISAKGKIKPITHDDIASIREYVKQRRPETRTFEIIQEGQTPIGNAKEGRRITKAWETAGATWWIESRWSKSAEAWPRIRQGPPK